MSSGAAQLPRQRGGTGRHRGAVIGCRAPQTLQPERGLGRPASAAVVVAVQDVRTPATPFVALSAVRTSAHLVARTSGVRASGVRASGVIRVSGQTGVRYPRPLRPRCPHRAGSRRSVPRDRPRLADRVRRVAVVPERLGRRCPMRPGWEEMVVHWQCVAGTRVDGRPGPPLRSRTGCGAALAAWPTKGAGPAPGCRSVGWGAREGAGAHESLAGTSLGQVAGVLLDHGRDRKVVTTRCVVVALVLVSCRPALEGPSGSAGHRLRPQRGRGV
jgi:hypothetical protein